MSIALAIAASAFPLTCGQDSLIADSFAFSFEGKSIYVHPPEAKKPFYQVSIWQGKHNDFSRHDDLPRAMMYVEHYLLASRKAA